MGMVNRLHGKPTALIGDNNYCPHCGREVDKFQLERTETGVKKICPHCKKEIKDKETK